MFLETRAVRRRQIAKQAEERRSEQKQRLAESCALFRLPIEVQMIIYVYAMSGNGGVIYVDWQRGPSLKYYRETFYECSKLWQQRSDGNSDPAVQVASDAIDKAIDEGALHHINGDIVLPRISDEHISTVRSLCTLARDTYTFSLRLSRSPPPTENAQSHARTIGSVSLPHSIPDSCRQTNEIASRRSHQHSS